MSDDGCDAAVEQTLRMMRKLREGAPGRAAMERAAKTRATETDATETLRREVVIVEDPIDAMCRVLGGVSVSHGRDVDAIVDIITPPVTEALEACAKALFPTAPDGAVGMGPVGDIAAGDLPIGFTPGDPVASRITADGITDASLPPSPLDMRSAATRPVVTEGDVKFQAVAAASAVAASRACGEWWEGRIRSVAQQISELGVASIPILDVIGDVGLAEWKDAVAATGVFASQACSGVAKLSVMLSRPGLGGMMATVAKDVDAQNAEHILVEAVRVGLAPFILDEASDAMGEVSFSGDAAPFAHDLEDAAGEVAAVEFRRQLHRGAGLPDAVRGAASAACAINDILLAPWPEDVPHRAVVCTVAALGEWTRHAIRAPWACDTETVLSRLRLRRGTAEQVMRDATHSIVPPGSRDVAHEAACVFGGVLAVHATPRHGMLAAAAASIVAISADHREGDELWRLVLDCVSAFLEGLSGLTAALGVATMGGVTALVDEDPTSWFAACGAGVSSLSHPQESTPWTGLLGSVRTCVPEAIRAFFKAWTTAAGSASTLCQPPQTVDTSLPERVFGLTFGRAALCLLVPMFGTDATQGIHVNHERRWSSASSMTTRRMFEGCPEWYHDSAVSILTRSFLAPVASLMSHGVDGVRHAGYMAFFVRELLAVFRALQHVIWWHDSVSATEDRDGTIRAVAEEILSRLPVTEDGARGAGAGADASTSEEDKPTVTRAELLDIIAVLDEVLELVRALCRAIDVVAEKVVAETGEDWGWLPPFPGAARARVVANTFKQSPDDPVDRLYGRSAKSGTGEQLEAVDASMATPLADGDPQTPVETEVCRDSFHPSAFTNDTHDVHPQMQLFALFSGRIMAAAATSGVRMGEEHDPISNDYAYGRRTIGRLLGGFHDGGLGDVADILESRGLKWLRDTVGDVLSQDAVVNDVRCEVDEDVFRTSLPTALRTLIPACDATHPGHVVFSMSRVPPPGSGDPCVFPSGFDIQPVEVFMHGVVEAVDRRCPWGPEGVLGDIDDVGSRPLLVRPLRVTPADVARLFKRLPVAFTRKEGEWLAHGRDLVGVAPDAEMGGVFQPRSSSCGKDVVFMTSSGEGRVVTRQATLDVAGLSGCVALLTSTPTDKRHVVAQTRDLWFASEMGPPLAERLGTTMFFLSSPPRDDDVDGGTQPPRRSSAWDGAIALFNATQSLWSERGVPCLLDSRDEDDGTFQPFLPGAVHAATGPFPLMLLMPSGAKPEDLLVETLSTWCGRHRVGPMRRNARSAAPSGRGVCFSQTCESAPVVNRVFSSLCDSVTKRLIDVATEDLLGRVLDMGLLAKDVVESMEVGVGAVMETLAQRGGGGIFGAPEWKTAMKALLSIKYNMNTLVGDAVKQLGQDAAVILRDGTVDEWLGLVASAREKGVAGERLHVLQMHVFLRLPAVNTREWFNSDFDGIHADFHGTLVVDADDMGFLWDGAPDDASLRAAIVDFADRVEGLFPEGATMRDVGNVFSSFLPNRSDVDSGAMSMDVAAVVSNAAAHLAAATLGFRVWRDVTEDVRMYCDVATARAPSPDDLPSKASVARGWMMAEAFRDAATLASVLARHGTTTAILRHGVAVSGSAAPTSLWTRVLSIGEPIVSLQTSPFPGRSRVDARSRLRAQLPDLLTSPSHDAARRVAVEEMGFASTRLLGPDEFVVDQPPQMWRRNEDFSKAVARSSFACRRDGVQMRRFLHTDRASSGTEQRRVIDSNLRRVIKEAVGKREKPVFPSPAGTVNVFSPLLRGVLPLSATNVSYTWAPFSGYVYDADTPTAGSETRTVASYASGVANMDLASPSGGLLTFSAPIAQDSQLPAVASSLRGGDVTVDANVSRVGRPGIGDFLVGMFTKDMAGLESALRVRRDAPAAARRGALPNIDGFEVDVAAFEDTRVPGDLACSVSSMTALCHGFGASVTSYGATARGVTGGVPRSALNPESIMVAGGVAWSAQIRTAGHIRRSGREAALQQLHLFRDFSETTSPLCGGVVDAAQMQGYVPRHFMMYVRAGVGVGDPSHRTRCVGRLVMQLPARTWGANVTGPTRELDSGVVPEQRDYVFNDPVQVLWVETQRVLGAVGGLLSHGAEFGVAVHDFVVAMPRGCGVAFTAGGDGATPRMAPGGKGMSWCIQRDVTQAPCVVLTDSHKNALPSRTGCPRNVPDARRGVSDPLCIGARSSTIMDPVHSLTSLLHIGSGPTSHVEAVQLRGGATNSRGSVSLELVDTAVLLDATTGATLPRGAAVGMGFCLLPPGGGHSDVAPGDPVSIGTSRWRLGYARKALGRIDKSGREALVGRGVPLLNTESAKAEEKLMKQWTVAPWRNPRGTVVTEQALGEGTALHAVVAFGEAAQVPMRRVVSSHASPDFNSCVMARVPVTHRVPPTSTVEGLVTGYGVSHGLVTPSLTSREDMSDWLPTPVAPRHKVLGTTVSAVPIVDPFAALRWSGRAASILGHCDGRILIQSHVRVRVATRGDSPLDVVSAALASTEVDVSQKPHVALGGVLCGLSRLGMVAVESGSSC